MLLDPFQPCAGMPRRAGQSRSDFGAILWPRVADVVLTCADIHSLVEADESHGYALGAASLACIGKPFYEHDVKHLVSVFVPVAQLRRIDNAGCGVRSASTFEPRDVESSFDAGRIEGNDSVGDRWTCPSLLGDVFQVGPTAPCAASGAAVRSAVILLRGTARDDGERSK